MKRQFVSLLLIFVLVGLLTGPVLAQEVTEVPTVAPTAEATPEVTEEAPDVIIIDGSDLEPVIDEFTGSLADVLKYASPVLALAAFLLIVGLKYVFPDTVVDTKTIFGWVTGGFAIVYALAEFAGVVPQLMAGLDILNQLAGPALQLAIILFLPSGFRYLAWKWDIPGLNAKQGNKAFSLEEQPPKAAQTR